MSFLRWSAASIAAILSGLVAVGCWYAGLVTDLGDGSRGSRVLWLGLAAGAVVIGVAVWAWLLPRERPWGLLAVTVSVAAWFVLLGGLNIA